jgi:hypothetical protein
VNAVDEVKSRVSSATDRGDTAVFRVKNVLIVEGLENNGAQCAAAQARNEQETEMQLRLSLVLDLTIGSLVNGQTFKCNDIGEVLEYEQNVRLSCEAFKNYLTVMHGFGGEEVVNYGEESSTAATA